MAPICRAVANQLILQTSTASVQSSPSTLYSQLCTRGLVPVEAIGHRNCIGIKKNAFQKLSNLEVYPLFFPQGRVSASFLNLFILFHSQQHLASQRHCCLASDELIKKIIQFCYKHRKMSNYYITSILRYCCEFWTISLELKTKLRDKKCGSTER